MEQRTDSPYPKKDRPVLAVIGVLLVVSTVLFAWSDRKHDWRYYQYAFRAQVAEKLGAEKAATIPTGVQQIWVSELRRADRCITCHQAMLWKGFEKAENPFKSHPAEPLKGHPIEKYGCTSCHGGQGWAIDAAAAHGPVEHWEEPLLGSQLGEAYTLVGQQGRAHADELQRLPPLRPRDEGGRRDQPRQEARPREGLPRLPRHQRPRRHDRPGPDLGRRQGAGAVRVRPPLGPEDAPSPGTSRTSRIPARSCPDTVMPNFHFSTREAQALAMLALSWRRAPIPADYRPGLPRTDPQTPEEIAEEQRMKTGPGAWFVKTGCFVCHSIQALGVKSPAQIGPGPLDRGRGHAGALRPHGRRLPARADRHDGRRPLAPDHPDPGGEGGRRRRSSARRSPSTRSRRPRERPTAGRPLRAGERQDWRRRRRR